MDRSRNSFTGSLGFVLAAAGSAVGLGNIWRFPYLAAKDGGGLFLVVYLVLALTFGFTLLTTEVAIGRKTKQSPLTAYQQVKKGWNWLGIASCIVPMMILPYYCVIGGWVLKYFIVFVTGHMEQAATDSFFKGYITNQTDSTMMMAIFLVIVAVIIFMGVNAGIENISKVMMPILLVLVIGIAVFCMTLKYEDGGVVRTGLQGFRILVVPDLKGITLRSFFTVVMDAMGQLFYSLSVAMGIMIAYGSYVKDDASLVSSINQIEIFDTVVAFLAGVMIIPAVYVFMGREGMSAGPSLMFVSLPKIFVQMGSLGRIIGSVFFLMVLFAAITSAMSILEAIVSSLMDQFHLERQTATILESILALLFGIFVCMGYNSLNFEVTLPNGSVGKMLDVMDYVSNNVLMPVVAIGTCILIGWVMGPQVVLDEVEKTGKKLGRRGLYVVMIKFVAPILLLVLLLKSLGILTII